MRIASIITILFFIHACDNVGRKPSIMASPDSMPAISFADTLVFPADTLNLKRQKVQPPEGIYQVILPSDSERIEHTIRFFPDRTYQLQERFYPASRVELTEGTWSPSDGFIWLYRQQVVRARYKWKSDTLQYFSPSLNKAFHMRKPPLIQSNDIWQQRSTQGMLFFGVGNEPFWSVAVWKELVEFRLADWSEARSFRITGTKNNNGNLVYTASNDSSAISVTVFPYFCSDGMSDFIYPRQVHISYSDQQFSGCGVQYR